jgi:hypothetical protein
MQAALLTLALVTGGPVEIPQPGYAAGAGYEVAGEPMYEEGGEYLPHTCLQPQTCYAPRFGCYYGGDRFMHRYPAFHGYYWRQPYNYRNVFDYPWHAGLHEPTSLYAYNVEEQGDPRRLGPAPTKATRGVTRKPTNTTLARGHSGARPMKTPRAVELEGRLALIQDELERSERQALAEAEQLRRETPDAYGARPATVVVMPRPTAGTLPLPLPQASAPASGPALSVAAAAAPAAPASPPAEVETTALPPVETASEAEPEVAPAVVETKPIEPTAPDGWRAKSSN